MKQTLIVFLSFISISLISQSTEIKTGFSLKKFTIHAAAEQDMIYGLDYQYFTSQIPSSEDFPLSGVAFDKSDLTSGICENPSLGLELALTHSSFKNIEWRNSINFVKDRIDAIQYNNNNYWDDDYSSVSFTNYHDEISIESALMYDLKLGPLHLYAGAGTNMGITFNNRMTVGSEIIRLPQDMPNGDALPTGNESFDEFGLNQISYSLSPIFTQRIFMQGGAAVVLFKKVELGVEFKRGIGYRTVGSKIRGTHLTGFQLRAGYRL